MINILKEQYVIEINSNILYIHNIIENSVISVKVKNSLDFNRIMSICYDGFSSEVTKGINSKIVNKILEYHPNIFYHCKKENLISTKQRIQHLRKILLIFKNKHTLSQKKLEKYLNAYANQKIYVDCHENNKIIENKLKLIGFQHVYILEVSMSKSLSEGDILITTPDFLETSVLIPKGVTILFFDLNRGVFGPIWTPEIHNEIEFYERNKTILNAEIPSYALDILFSFLCHSLIYLISTLYKDLTVDVSIPFRKEYTLQFPEMQVVARLYDEKI
ncbi:hypothetical protein [Streptococcus ruminantium]|uniref:hypothetical protein n=2 Tax=Streptococcus ruminantium TaxID=1917441 RepID=UPI0012DCBE08|nr:hypothetical protein [Streptococcus ruminantium]BDD38867.1 hypothetical protein GUT183_11050 [Streptococcus ruminantium]